MGEQVEDKIGDVDMSNSEMMFDNLTILKEFSNIVNIVRNEEFLKIIPKSKLRVKWIPMFNCLKHEILNEMIQEFSEMWKYENMPQKLALLEEQKEKFNYVDTENKLWRPQLNDVNAQLRAHDVADLQKQKIILETKAKEYEARVNRLKKTLTAKRGYVKALQMDIQKYQKKNEDFLININANLEYHNNLAKANTTTKTDIENVKYVEE